MARSLPDDALMRLVTLLSLYRWMPGSIIPYQGFGVVWQPEPHFMHKGIKALLDHKSQDQRCSAVGTDQGQPGASSPAHLLAALPGCEGRRTSESRFTFAWL
jgi:hypothetical protein